MRGQKTPPEVIYQIISSWAVTNSFSKTAKELELPVKTVEKIVKENKDKEEFAKVCNEKKADFAEKAGEIINLALDRLKKEIASRESNISVNHLTTVIGTLYDKRALAKGEATENTTVSIRLPEGFEEYAG